MPLSIWLGLEDTLRSVVAARPQAVLDAGIGFGLYGHLLRQYLDVWEGRVQRDAWRIRIDGIEIDARRVQPHARYLYDDIHIGDIRARVPELAARTRYDVILFGDVLEHLPKPDALALLRQAVALAARLVVVRIPLGDGWRREGREEADHHRSTWALEDFVDLVHEARVYDYLDNDYALLAIDAPSSRTTSLRRADVRLQRLERQLQRRTSASQRA